MKPFRFMLCGAMVAFASLVQAQSESLEMGIFPYVSAGQMMKHQRHVIKHLNKNSGIRVSPVTARDVPEYIRKLKKKEYDLIYSAPHLARYAEKHLGYQRVAMTRNRIGGVFLSRKDSSLNSIEQLQNKTLSLGPVKTILHQIALRQLINMGLEPGRNIRIKTVETHNNAIYDVINGESDAAVTGIKIWHNLRADDRAKLQEFGRTDTTSGFIVLARPGIDQAVIERLRQALLSFNDTLAGKTYLFKGFKTISDQEMKELDFHSTVFE